MKNKNPLVTVVWLSLLCTNHLIMANTFTDNKTNLMWQDTKEEPLSYENAINYCDELILDGYDDWRLPKITELKSIVDYTKFNPAIKDGFITLSSDKYWSSSLDVSFSFGAWVIGFYNGHNEFGYKYLNSVRCVRNNEELLKVESFSSLYNKAKDYEISKILVKPKETKKIKGKFEKTSEFETRTKKEELKYQQADKEYQKQYDVFLPKIKSKAMEKSLAVYYGKPMLNELEYDADNEQFNGKLGFENNDITTDIVIKFSPKEAEKFSEEYEKLMHEVIFDFNGTTIKAILLRFTYNEKVYEIPLGIENKIEEKISDDK